MTKITDEVIKFLKEFNLCDKTLIVGFSGGYDSMTLLNVLADVRQKEGFENMKVIAAHFNHNWRGEESLKEQEVCSLFAASRGIEFVLGKAPSSLKKTENDARIARYEFFEEVCEDYDGDAVLTAHNRDDNAETVLYRVVKGTGLYGLKGISRRRGFFYRPLLRVPRSEILEYCTKHNLTPNNDSSNANTKYNRNYLRLSVIPALEKINPLVKDSLNTLAEVAASEDAIIEEYMSTIRGKVFKEDAIIPSAYAPLSESVKMRLLHEYARVFDLDYDFKKIKELYEFIENNIYRKNGSTISLTASQWLYADDKIVEVIPHRNNSKTSEDLNNREILIMTEGEYEFAGKILSLKKFVEKDVFVFPDATANFVYVDLSGVTLPLSVRTRRDGDIITPFGMTGTMKLKKYLNSKGIPRHNRDNLIVLASDDEILWVVGVGLSNKIGVNVQPTHVIEVRNKEI